MSKEASLFAIGVIVRPHGVKGWLRLKLHNPLSEALVENQYIYLLDPSSPSSQAPTPYQLTYVHPSEPGIVLVRLEGISTRNDAEMLQSMQVFIDRENLPPLEADEIYLSDLVGFQVMVDDKKIGEVVEIQFLGGQDLIRIRGESGAEILVPFVSEIVPQIDKTTRSIHIRPPEGLVDLNQKPAAL